MGFLRSQLIETRRLPVPSGSYAGKTIVITGSNTGLGKEAARHYARLGASRLILGVRNLDKGNAAKADIATTAAKSVDIQVWHIDMASYASVKAFAARVSSELDRVDIFHANAGMVTTTFALVEGNETMITVNVISTYLLVALVLPKLKAVAAQYNIRPTLSITSSGAHAHTKFHQAREPDIFAALNDPKYADGAYWNEAYPISKLLGVYAMRAIAEERPADSYPVTLNLVSPGLCNSELSREATGVQKVAFGIMKTVLARTTEEGSRTLVHAGSSGAESHGQYMIDCRVGSPEPIATENKEVQDRVWRELKAKLEEIQPGVTANF